MSKGGGADSAPRVLGLKEWLQLQTTNMKKRT